MKRNEERRRVMHACAMAPSDGEPLRTEKRHRVWPNVGTLRIIVVSSVLLSCITHMATAEAMPERHNLIPTFVDSLSLVQVETFYRRLEIGKTTVRNMYESVGKSELTFYKDGSDSYLGYTRGPGTKVTLATGKVSWLNRDFNFFYQASWQSDGIPAVGRSMVLFTLHFDKDLLVGVTNHAMDDSGRWTPPDPNDYEAFMAMGTKSTPLEFDPVAEPSVDHEPISVGSKRWVCEPSLGAAVMDEDGKTLLSIRRESEIEGKIGTALFLVILAGIGQPAPTAFCTLYIDGMPARALQGSGEPATFPTPSTFKYKMATKDDLDFIDLLQQKSQLALSCGGSDRLVFHLTGAREAIQALLKEARD